MDRLILGEMPVVPGAYASRLWVVLAREAKRRSALSAAPGALYRVPSVGVECGQSARALEWTLPSTDGVSASLVR